MRYRRIEILSTSEDRTVAELFSAGCLGVEQAPHGRPSGAGSSDLGAREVRLIAYFDDGATTPGDEDWASWGAQKVDERLLEEQDWLRSYRLSVEPIPVGENFVLDASEPDGELIPGVDVTERHLLRLPARQAFGTGSHATTQLMVEGLERLDPKGRRVLDVGVGTGVLSFVAQILGAASVVAYDLDPKSPVAALDNALLNNLEAPRLFVGGAAALAARPMFDLLLVNILEDRIDSDIPHLGSVLETGGLALVSGILVERQEQVTARWSEQGLRVEESHERDEWLLLLMKKI